MSEFKQKIINIIDHISANRNNQPCVQRYITALRTLADNTEDTEQKTYCSDLVAQLVLIMSQESTYDKSIEDLIRSFRNHMKNNLTLSL